MKVFVKLLILLGFMAVASWAYAGEEGPFAAFLKRGNYKELEFAAQSLQSKFENGQTSENELRNSYRQFYDLDQESVSNLNGWKRAFPLSYAAHLARGIYYKRKGLDVRGEGPVNEVPKENMERMRQYFEIAEQDLEASLKLTPKPFLSVFHLLDISKISGDRYKAALLLASSIKILPNNMLVRNRYMLTLTPRWGGSYEEMEQFVRKARGEGLTPTSLMQLEAIIFDDKGLSSLEHGDQGGAISYFAKAQDLGERVGGEFSKDFLVNSKRHVCRVQDLLKYCK